MMCYKKTISILLLVALFSMARAQYNTSVSPFPALTGARGSAWADYDQDGDMDLFLSGMDETGNIITDIFQSGPGGYTKLNMAITPVFNAASLWKDFNGDGILDIIYTGLNSAGEACSGMLISDNGLFTPVNAPIVPLKAPTLLARDFDQDGRIEIIAYGMGSESQASAYAWSFQNGNFTEKAIDIPLFTFATLAPLHVNNDNFTDLLVCGLDSWGSKVTRVLINNKGLSFIEKPLSIPALSNGNLAISDIDNNGLDDVLISGFDAQGQRHTGIYINDGNDNFSPATANNAQLANGDVLFTDYNVDGYPDALISGTNELNQYTTQLLTNHSDGTFTVVPDMLPGLGSSAIRPADTDLDGDQDLLIMGHTTAGLSSYIFNNTNESARSAPTTPEITAIITNHDSVTIQWSPATDGQTPTEGLTYEMILWHNDKLLSSPESHLQTGNRLVSKTGQYKGATLTLKGLEEGKYTVAIQSVDPSFSASPFSTATPFTICHNPELGPDQNLCENSIIRLLSPGEGVNKWHSLNLGLLAENTNNISFQVMEDDTIVLELTKPLGCTVYDSVVITSRNLPQPNLGEDIYKCIGEELQFNSNAAWTKESLFSSSFGWLYASENTYQYTVLEKDTLIQTALNVEGCTQADTVIINPQHKPVFTLGPDLSVCRKDTLSISLSLPVDWLTYRDGLLLSNQSEVHLPITRHMELIARATNDFGCTNSDTLLINMLEPERIYLGADINICHGDTLHLNAGTTWQQVSWYDTFSRTALNSTAIEQVITNDSQLHVHTTDLQGCKSSDTLNIHMLPLPVATVPREVPVCLGENIHISLATENSTVQWRSTMYGFFDTGPVLDYTPTSSDTAIFTITNTKGCLFTDSTFISVLKPEKPDLGADVILCPEDTLHLALDDQWKSLAWYIEDSLFANGNHINMVASHPATLYVKSIDQKGCTSGDTLNIHIAEIPLIDLGTDRTVCPGTGVLLENRHPSQGRMMWYQEGALLSEGDSILLNVQSPSSILAEIISTQNCIGYDTVNFTLHDIRPLPLADTIKTCLNDTVNLDAGMGWQQVAWLNTANEEISRELRLTYTTTQNQLILFKAFDDNGCRVTDSLYLSTRPLPVAEAGENQLVCRAGGVIIGPKENQEDTSLKYTWSPKYGLDDPNVLRPVSTPDSTLTYTLTVTDTMGCHSVDTVTVIRDLLSVINPGMDTAICSGGAIALGGRPTASGSKLEYQYAWSPTEVLDNPGHANPIARPATDTRFRLITSVGDCIVDTSYTTIKINPLPLVGLSGDMTIGYGQTTSLTASGGTTYYWTPEGTIKDPWSPTPRVSPLESTTYTVSITDRNHCTNTGSVHVFVKNSLFIPNLFTPNSDGSNDHFRIYGTGVKSCLMRVYDQTGIVVFETNDLNVLFEVGWNGKIRGKEVPEGNYIWTIEGVFFDGTPLQINGINSGIITLLR
ncbi:MAG: FG-GAP-like repeat-containing protein [Cyclobacteriaceae bacterium]|nr:FG-GAP-like repeat-containing protein [Cyclobacteriaceae bacterium]